MHFALSQYELSRRKYSSLSVAVVCHILQEQQDLEALQKRDTWLNALHAKYQIDLADVFEVLCLLRAIAGKCEPVPVPNPGLEMPEFGRLSLECKHEIA